jgi:pyrroloquinoline quinone (PQQ) biosynthesis protein C
VLHRFAREYHGYVSWFPHFLERAMFRLPEAVQQLPWQRRLARELGYLGEVDRDDLRRLGISPRNVVDVPHATLFRRFAAAVGVRDDELTHASSAAARWRERLLAFLGEATPAEALGALALGTECVDRHVHAPVLRGLLALGTLRRDALAWFELHCQAETRHLQELRHVAAMWAETPGGLDELRAGMHAALDLRCEFFDRLAVLTLEAA